MKRFWKDEIFRPGFPAAPIPLDPSQPRMPSSSDYGLRIITTRQPPTQLASQYTGLCSLPPTRFDAIHSPSPVFKISRSVRVTLVLSATANLFSGQVSTGSRFGFFAAGSSTPTWHCPRPPRSGCYLSDATTSAQLDTHCSPSNCDFGVYTTLTHLYLLFPF